MQRVSGANYLANGNGAGKNAYQDYNPATGQAGTTPNAAALNAMQEEIAGFIEAQGIVLDPTNNGQLVNAIAAYVTARLVSYETVAAATSGLAAALAGMESSAQAATDIANALASYTPLSSFGKSLAANGYQKLPGGLILQWGSVTGSFSQGLLGPYGFPIAFPNACFNLQLTTISPESAGGAAGDDFFQVPSTNMPTPAQFYAFCDLISSGIDRANGFYWFAIGY